MREGNIHVKNDYACIPLAGEPRSRHYRFMENLHRIRRDRGMTQAQLAKATGLSQGTISKIEKGTFNLSLDNIQTIAKALNVAPYELFSLSEIKARAVSAIGQMTPDQQAAAIVVLETMAGLKRR